MKTEPKNTEPNVTEDPGLILNLIHGERILDVATGTGANINHLIDSLGRFSEIVAIDVEKPERIKELDRDGIFRCELWEIVEKSCFKDNRCFDIVDYDRDPFDEDRKKYFSDAIEKYLQRTEILKNLFFLKEAKALLDRMYDVGIRWAPVLPVICKK